MRTLAKEARIAQFVRAERERAALEWAADAIKEQDGGDMTTDTGWKSEEALAHWLTIRAMAGIQDADCG